MNKGFRFGSRTREVNREVMEERASEAATPKPKYANSDTSDFDYNVGDGGFLVASGNSLHLCQPGMEAILIHEEDKEISCVSMYDKKILSYATDNTINKQYLGDDINPSVYGIHGITYGIRGGNVSCLHVHTDGKPYDCGEYGIVSTNDLKKVHEDLDSSVHDMESKGNAILAVVDDGVIQAGIGFYYYERRNLFSLCYHEKQDSVFCGALNQILKFSSEPNQTFPIGAETVCTRNGIVSTIRSRNDNGAVFDSCGRYIFNTLEDAKGEDPILKAERFINDFVLVDGSEFELLLNYAKKQKGGQKDE
jgi:hypothetical protein